MARIQNYTEVKNGYGQKTIRGQIKLLADTDLYNNRNNGKEAWDFVKPVKIVARKGTLVEYEGQETRTGFYHTVTLKNGKGVFSATRKTGGE